MAADGSDGAGATLPFGALATPELTPTPPDVGLALTSAFVLVPVVAPAPALLPGPVLAVVLLDLLGSSSNSSTDKHPSASKIPAKPFRFLFFFCPALGAVVFDIGAAFDFVAPLTLGDAGVLTVVFDVEVVGWVCDEAGFGSAFSAVVWGAEEAVVDGVLFDNLRDKFSRGVPLPVSPSVDLMAVDVVPDSGRVV